MQLGMGQRQNDFRACDVSPSQGISKMATTDYSSWGLWASLRTPLWLIAWALSGEPRLPCTATWCRSWAPSSHFCSLWSCSLTIADWSKDEYLTQFRQVRGPYKGPGIVSKKEPSLILGEANAEGICGFCIVNNITEETSLQGEGRTRHLTKHKETQRSTGFISGTTPQTSVCTWTPQGLVKI